MTQNPTELTNQRLTKRELRAQRRAAKLAEIATAAQRSKFKKTITWIISLLVVAAVIFGLTRLASKDQDANQLIPEVNEVSLQDQVKGNEQATITLVEYSDFECPACASYYPLVERLLSEYGEQMRLVYRHFPLSTIHSFAELAARASEAAGRQGKFWDMYSLLFERQRDWSNGEARKLFLDYASELGLDPEQFAADLDSDAIKEKVKDDYASGLRANVNSTPTFFLNGRKIANPSSYEELAETVKTLIDLEASLVPNESK